MSIASIVLGALLAVVTTAEIGSLKDGDRVVTSVGDLRSDSIEKSGLPGPEPGVTVTRKLSADLTVTDTPVPPYVVVDVPIVTTNYDTSLVPIVTTNLVSVRAPSYLDVESPEGHSLRLPYDSARSLYGLLAWTDFSHKADSAFKVPYYFSFSGAGSEIVNVYRSPENSYDTYRFEPTGGGGQNAGKIGSRFVKAIADGTVCDYSDLYDNYWHTVPLKITPGPQDPTLPVITSYSSETTNGWRTVTNSVTVVTNGFYHVTNSLPAKVSGLMTEEMMSGRLDGLGTNGTGRFESAFTGAVMRTVLSNARGIGNDPNVETGTEKLVLTNSDVGPIESASVDSQRLQPGVDVRDPSVLHVDSMQSVVVGGRKVNGRYVGGKTLHALVGEYANSEIQGTVSVEPHVHAVDNLNVADVRLPTGSVRIEVPEYGKTGSASFFVGNDLNVMQMVYSNVTWDVQSSCFRSDLVDVFSMRFVEVTVDYEGVVTTAKWTVDRSTFGDRVQYFPLPQPNSTNAVIDAGFLYDNTNNFITLSFRDYKDSRGRKWVVGYDTPLGSGSFMEAYGGRVGDGTVEFENISASGFMRFIRRSDTDSYESLGQVASTKTLLDPKRVPVPQVTNPTNHMEFIRFDGTVGYSTSYPVTNRVAWLVSAVNPSSGLQTDKYSGPYDSGDGEYDGMTSWAGVCPTGIDNSSRVYLSFSGDTSSTGMFTLKVVNSLGEVVSDQSFVNQPFSSKWLYFFDMRIRPGDSPSSFRSFVLERKDVSQASGALYPDPYIRWIPVQMTDTNATVRTISAGNPVFRTAVLAVSPTNNPAFTANRTDGLVVTDSAEPRAQVKLIPSLGTTGSAAIARNGTNGWTEVLIPDNAGTVRMAYRNAESLNEMLDDALAQPAKAASGAKVMALIDQPVTTKIVNTVNETKSRFYDAGLGVEWTFVPYNGEYMFIATTNVNREVIE